VDHGVERWIELVYANDGRLDQLSRRNLAFPHQLGETERVGFRHRCSSRSRSRPSSSRADPSDRQRNVPAEQNIGTDAVIAQSLGNGTPSIRDA
jgi:hypothetical protein